MSTFKITLQSTKAYLTAIAGLTKLAPKETEVLAEIIDFMQQQGLYLLDDRVRDHIMRKFEFSHIQTYYNLIAKYRKSKLLLYSHNKTQLKPMLMPGTILEIKFKEAEVLKEFEVNE
jgi:hypothetical protein